MTPLRAKYIRDLTIRGRVLAQILTELGFKRVVGIVDGDHPEIAQLLSEQFPTFKFFVIPSPDIRTKPETPARPGKEGLLDLTGTLQSRFREEIARMILDVNTYLCPAGS
jgi:hypothetical protein